MKSKKLILSFCAVVIAALSFGLISPAVSLPVAADAYAATSVASSASTWTTQYTGNYYDNLNDSGTGAAFRTNLAQLITNTHKTETTYSGLANVYKTSDADPNKSGNIIWFYTGTSVSFKSFGGSSGDTNREHVWPKNSGKAFPAESKAGSDAHHLRPTETNLNSTRSSKSFDEVAKTTSNRVKENGSTSYGNNNDLDTFCYTSGSFFYPAKGYRGATARILFYVQTRWGNDYNLTFVDSAGSNKTIGKISTLMKWHLEEPPTDEEIRRNEAVFKIQGNRNPFIDHPEYAAQIYCYDGQSYNNALKQVVAQYGNYNEEVPDITNLTITPNSALNLSIGETATFNVNVTPSNANKSVTWSSSNANVAKVVNGVVTATGNGQAVITATSNANSAIKASVTVNVKSVTGIEVSGTLSKTAYVEGDKFDPTGLTVKILYSDGAHESYDDSSGLSIFDWLDAKTLQPTLTVSTTGIVCKYGSFSCNVNAAITVVEDTRTITGIFITGALVRTSYYAGERFNPSGLTVTIRYSDNSQESYSGDGLDKFEWLDADTLQPTLTVSTSRIICRYNGKECPVTASITVAATSPSVTGFIEKVDGIENAKTLKERHELINVALQAYSQLSASEKEQARETYQRFVKVVEMYNETAETYNSSLDSAAKFAAQAVSVSALAALAIIVISRIRQGGAR
ncbi:MAG: endonuclease [Corallococcus sp.]|nr:endonuclease [Corallococcus sp.]